MCTCCPATASAQKESLPLVRHCLRIFGGALPPARRQCMATGSPLAAGTRGDGMEVDGGAEDMDEEVYALDTVKVGQQVVQGMTKDRLG